MLKMSVSATFRGNFSSLLIPQSSYCPCDYRPRHILASSSVISRRKRCRTRDFKLYQVSEFCERREIIVCRAAETEIEPDNSNNDNKEKEVHEGGEEHPTIDSVGQTDDQPDSQPTILNQINGGEITTGGGTQEADDEVVSGSPLPGVKPQQLDESIRIPKETIDILRNQVFGFDTFFVTSQEPYEGGVLFKGNLRGQAAKSYEKLTNRMQNKLGDEYKIFLLVNPEDDKPVAVVVPRKTLQPETTAVPEWFAAGAFGLVTIFTLLLRNVPALQSNLLSTFDNPELLMDGLPGALVTALVLGAHELSHILVAKSNEVKLGVPYFVPSWQIGSFGAITRITSIVPKREVLLKVAVAGPLAGFSLGLVLFLLGFILPPRDGIGLVVDASVFHESFLAGGIAKLLLGDVLKEGTPISVNPLVIWAWAGLLINAINSIPAGELDGGRISFAIWGRKASARFTGFSIVLLGLSSLLNDVAFFWVVLIFFLQRGPISPVSEEISDPENKYVALGLLVLVLGLLVTGELHDDLTCWDALRAALPVGTVSGAPKVKAMELIDQMEVSRRGPYSGGLGGVSFTGDMDIALALRTMVFPTGTQYNTMYSYKDAQLRREWIAYLQAGAGIVAESVPKDEHRECQNKVAGIARTIDLAESTFVNKS